MCNLLNDNRKAKLDNNINNVYNLISLMHQSFATTVPWGRKIVGKALVYAMHCEDVLCQIPCKGPAHSGSLGLDARKPVIGVSKIQRRRTVCASEQSDQRLCYSLIRRFHI